MQEIILFRIDDRLIHGQVAAVWTKHLKQTRIVVVDDEANGNELQKQLLKMACPPGVKLSVLTVEKTINNFNNNKYEGDKIMMIAKSPDTVRQLVERDFQYMPKEVIVGNMSGSNDKRKVAPGFNVNEKDVSNFKKIAECGVASYYQLLPNNNKEEVFRLIV